MVGNSLQARTRLWRLDVAAGTSVRQTPAVDRAGQRLGVDLAGGVPWESSLYKRLAWVHIVADKANGAILQTVIR